MRRHIKKHSLLLTYARILRSYSPDGAHVHLNLTRWLLGSTPVCFPARHHDRFIRFAGLTGVLNT